MKYNAWKDFSFLMFALSVLSFCIGAYKLFFYEGEESEKPVNMYVGGDAYNYIINGTYATAYFVLMGSFLIAGILMQIIYKIDSNKIVNEEV